MEHSGRIRQGGTVAARYQGGVALAQRKRPRPGGTCCPKMRSAKLAPQQVQVPSGRGASEIGTRDNTVRQIFDQTVSGRITTSIRSFMLTIADVSQTNVLSAILV
jgi:hypothetical protein